MKLLQDFQDSNHFTFVKPSPSCHISCSSDKVFIDFRNTDWNYVGLENHRLIEPKTILFKISDARSLEIHKTFTSTVQDHIRKFSGRIADVMRRFELVFLDNHKVLLQAINHIHPDVRVSQKVERYVRRVNK